MGVKTHATGRKMMDLETARLVAAQFRELGGFSEVKIDEFGFDSGCYCVQLWSANAKAGNRTLHSVDLPPVNEKQAKLIRKMALGKASDRDRAAYGRMEAERTA